MSQFVELGLVGGHTDVTARHDQEHARGALTGLIRDCGDGVTRHRTVWRQPPTTRWRLHLLDELRGN